MGDLRPAIFASIPWEHRSEPLASRAIFLRRMVAQFLLAASFVVATLLSGMAGYMSIAKLDATDAFLEAAMLLSGAGPLYTERSSSNEMKIFSSCYALFSTLIVVSIVAIMASPIVHRVLHRLHLERSRPG